MEIKTKREAYLWNELMRSKNMIIKKWPKEGKSTRMERVREGRAGVIEGGKGDWGNAWGRAKSCWHIDTDSEGRQEGRHRGGGQCKGCLQEGRERGRDVSRREGGEMKEHRDTGEVKGKVKKRKTETGWERKRREEKLREGGQRVKRRRRENEGDWREEREVNRKMWRRKQEEKREGNEGNKEDGKGETEIGKEKMKGKCRGREGAGVDIRNMSGSKEVQWWGTKGVDETALQ